MKIFALAILRKADKDGVSLSSAFKLDDFGFFQRGSVKEFIQFFMKTVTGRSQPGTRNTVTEQEYACHCYVRLDGLAGCVVTDAEYPPRVAFSLINQLLDDFSAKYPKTVWVSAKEPDTPMPELEEQLAKFQNPAEADKLMKIQKDLDETKIILHKTIESVLERGEKLDSLVEKSEDLSRQSKTFYKTAKQTNSCCTFM
eukprot:comp11561_c0_seq1/m.6031 comp11561_c0_seq1/g.6031  ORF comp11561_c0_seq1/g.6031 comp11561_c0_seq1/m.6031 type:complete len:199 (-) comp11561_c0_seq1:99-695(-)